MRSPLPAVAFAVLLVARPVRAAETDPSLAVFTAGSVDAIGFIVGGALIGTARGHDERVDAGWLTIEAGFTLSSLAAHGVVGEWGRGAAFAALPASTLAGTAAVFDVKPDGIAYGTLPEQRLVWGLFTAGFLTSIVGAIDAVLVSNRAQTTAFALSPALGPGHIGLRFEGDL